LRSEGFPFFFLPVTVSIDGGFFLFVFQHSCGMVGFAIRRERPHSHIVTVFAYGTGNDSPHIGVLPREFRHWVKGQPQDVMQHQDLAVAIRPCSDSDRGNAQFTRNLRRQFARHRFQHHGKRAGGFHRSRIADQVFRGIPRFPLHAVTA